MSSPATRSPGLDHVLDGNFGSAEMLLERVLLGRRVTEPELELGRRRNAAVGQVTAPARAISRRKRRLEEPRCEFDDVVQRLPSFLARLGLGRRHRHRNTGLPRQALDRFRETHALGEHDEIENVAVLAGGEVEPHRLAVIDEKRRRLLLIERRQPFPLAPRLAQFYASAHDFRDRKPRAQLIEKLRRESHGDSEG